MDEQQPLAASSPLDQLEAQLSLVLEHTGRIFAGRVKSRKTHGVVDNSSRLRQVLLGADGSFHDALDMLESELAIARAVMRRDLAVCRTALESRESDARTSKQTGGDGEVDTANPSGNDQTDAQDLDVSMTGDETSKLSPQGQTSSAQESTGLVAQSQSLDQGSGEEQTKQNDEQGQQDPMQIEIPSGEHQGDNQTDVATGTYSNFDFESLFNDPSAHPSPDVVQQTPSVKEASQTEPTSTSSAPDQSQTASRPGENVVSNANADDNIDTIDFGDLTNFDGGDSGMQGGDDNNDNISSLLPGLESYANASTNPAEQQRQGQQAQNAANQDSFNIFDSADGPDFGSAMDDNTTMNNNQTQAQQTQATQQTNANMLGTNDNNSNEMTSTQADDTTTTDQQQQEPRDDTFDALMNFDNFDMGSFGDDMGEGGPNDGSAFDASFFDI
ncbi:hypothetical protein AAFC00_006269 [Neodothiora populina]|uniref:Uncharacterized protein n=1 Tax=Neodothiora populina TaxID=2781224 RepID=A0ABR3P4T3_9PEZI